jgi:hypothetical protein
MNAKRNKFKTDFINTSSEEAKKITESIVKEKIDTDKDIWIYQDTKFEQSVRCKNIISIGEYWDINARDINAGDIYAWDINARDINARDINAWDINARDINAGDIYAWDINAGDINAGDINAGDINARDINAGDIYAWDINAWDINAGDINAWDILCESRKYKLKESKTICRIYIKDRSKIKKKERENGGGKWKK